MGNWEYDGNEQHLHLGSSGVTPDMSYTENGEWILANSCGFAHIIQGPEPLSHLTVILSVKLTRKSSCVNARGIPTVAHQVLHMLSYPGRGVGTLARGEG